MSQKISDNPEYLKLDEQIQEMQQLARFFPSLFSKEQRKQIDDLRTNLYEQRVLPDHFNALFANRGWVCYESMNNDLLIRCIELG